MKLVFIASLPLLFAQPPSGGCVLKLKLSKPPYYVILPAAFRRLCVETILQNAVIFNVPTSRLQAAVC